MSGPERDINPPPVFRNGTSQKYDCQAKKTIKIVSDTRTNVTMQLLSHHLKHQYHLFLFTRSVGFSPKYSL